MTSKVAIADGWTGASNEGALDNGSMAVTQNLGAIGKAISNTSFLGNKNSGGLTNMTSAGDSGSVETSSITHVTATEIVVVTTIIYYDASGQIIDVQVIISRFKRKDVSEAPKEDR